MTPAVLGTFLYLFAGPGTHASHGDGGRAGGSFALRLGLPLACGLIGDALAPPYSVDPAGDNKTHPGLIPGFLVGMSVASAIDITALAWTRAPATDAKAASSWVLLPSATMSRDKAGRQVPTFGVSGAF